MDLHTILREAYRSLSRNWIRSVLTVLGLAVGVGAFICVVAIGNAGSKRIEAQLSDLGDNFIWIEAGSRTRSGIRAGSRGIRTLVLQDADAIKAQVPLIKTMTPNVDGHITTVYGNQNWSTHYRGVGPEFLEIRRWNVADGSFFSQGDVASAALVCVLGQTVADNLFIGREPVGETIRVSNLPCKVTGVLAPKGASAMGQDQDDFIVMPYTTVMKKITGAYWLDDIFCSAESRAGMPMATQQIIAILRERHHLTPGQDDDFNIRSPEDIIKAQLATSHVMTLLLASVASLALLVGGVGIMNIMLVSVTQRTREIGVRLAVGATEWDVQVQFLSEAIVLSTLGGLLGLATGIGSSVLVKAVFGFPTQLTPAVLALGSLFSVGVGLLFGYYPAHKAAQLDPVEGLRYE